MRVRKWTIIILLVGLVVSAASITASAQNAQKQVGTVSITSPAKNSTVGAAQAVSGKAQIPSGYTVWIVPYDGIAGKYYPQGAPVTINDDAAWSTRLSLGNFSVGQKLQIQAVVADKSANSALSSYVSSGQKGGMKSLPAGAQAVESITVTRGTSTSTSTGSANASPSMIPIVTQNASTANTSTSNVVQASASAASSRSPLPGFEAIFAFSALAIAFVLVLRGRVLK